MELPSIKHGLLKNYIGSSKSCLGGMVVLVTANLTTQNSNKEELLKPPTFEVRCKTLPNSKPFESVCISLIHRILECFIVQDELDYKNIAISIYSNTFDLSLICNGVLVACLDGGIPLNSMFYSIGNDPLFVYSDDTIKFYHSQREITDKDIKQAIKELKSVKENIEYTFISIFSIK